MSVEPQLTLNICRLVAYLVANVVRDEREYLEFGLPFLQLMVDSQYGKEEGAAVGRELNDKFCPLVGHGICLYLEEDQEDFTHIHSAEQFLTNILNEVGAAPEPSEEVDRMELFVHHYVNTFLKYIIEHDVYDARTRQIMKKMCDILNVSGVEFRELENNYWYSTSPPCASGGCASGSCYFYERFNIDSRRMPAASMVRSFRFVRIAFISSAAAVLMALSGAAAAPAITSTILPLIYASDTLAKASVAFTTCLTSIGFTGFEIIPGLMSTYGALEAGKRMLHRTAPMAVSDFMLQPLVTSAGPTKSPDGSQPVDEVGPSGCLARTGAPICILVCGHLNEGTDPHELWSRRGFFVPAPAPSSTTVTASMTTSLIQGSSGIINAVLHQTMEAGVGIVGYRFTGDDDISPSVAGTTDKMASSTECVALKSISALDDSGNKVETTAVELSLDCAVASSSITEWEDVDASIGRYSPFPLCDQFLLQWEPLELKNLNVTFQKILFDNVFGRLRGMVKKEILKFTPYPAITAAASLPLMCLNKIKEIDDPWCVCIDRAEQAGRLLARVLLKNHGCKLAVDAPGSLSGSDKQLKTPITLIGYGMGARVIFHCLDTLANEADDAVVARGIVENVVLIGTPVSSTVSRWRAIRSVVAGRLVNCYATNDWILALLYRTKSYEIGVAGLYPVSIHRTYPFSDSSTQATTSCDPSGSKKDFVVPPQTAALLEVENLDVSHLISSHSDYPLALASILDLVKL